MKNFFKFFLCFMLAVPLLAVNTGTLKVFSEINDLQIFVDEKFVGTGNVEIANLIIGEHYVKALKSGQVVYSEIANIEENILKTILIKDTQELQNKVLDAKYKEQQEYKRNKLDILLSKAYQTQGSSYTYSDYFPGYYSIFGMGWTKSSASTFETTDWKIVKGGIQEISDLEFANLVNDKKTLDYYNQTVEDINNMAGIGAIVSLTGVVVAVAGFSSALSAANPDPGIIVSTLGIVATVIGLAILSDSPPTGHLVAPATAAQQAYDYNQALKAQLGLPENYEP